mmetsp:Transcript_70251/g.206030  ORF Transcript_70251/g.206030 Transcript_70251/m.206030 type:complete len:252 (+) Transcript_70251:1379-2134(+)
MGRGLDAGARHHAAHRELLELRDHRQRPALLHEHGHQLPHGDHGLHVDELLILVDLQDVDHAVRLHLEAVLLVGRVLVGHALPARPGRDDALLAPLLLPLLELRLDVLNALRVQLRRALHGLDVPGAERVVELPGARERQDEREHHRGPVQDQEALDRAHVGLLQVELVDVATGRRAVDVDRREADNHVDHADEGADGQHYAQEEGGQRREGAIVLELDLQLAPAHCRDPPREILRWTRPAPGGRPCLYPG